MADTCPFWGHWYPCFGFLVTSPLGLKARVSCLIRIAEANVMYIPRDPPLVLHLLTSCWLLWRTAGPVPTYCCTSEVAGIRTRALRISRRSTDWAKAGPTRGDLNLTKKVPKSSKCMFFLLRTIKNTNPRLFNSAYIQHIAICQIRQIWQT